MQKKRRYSRMKMKFAIALGVVLVFSIIFFSVLVSAKSSKPTEVLNKYYTSVQINKGDTLWDIAKKYCPDTGQLKAYVTELKKINQLDTDEIHAGNYLTIVYYSKEIK